MSGFVQAARGLLSRVAHVLSAMGSIRPAAWALALMALTAATAMTPGSANAQAAFSLSPSSSVKILEVGELSEAFGGGVELYGDYGSQGYVSYIEFSIPAGVAYSNVSLVYSTSDPNGSEPTVVRVTSAENVDPYGANPAAGIRGGALYADFNLPSSGLNGTVALSANAVHRMNQIAQSGGGAFQIGLAGDVYNYHFFPFSSITLQGLAVTTAGSAVMAPTVVTPANASVLTTPTVNLAGTVTPGATYVVQLGGDGSIGNTPVVATGGTWTRTLTGLRNGNYFVRVIDQTNNLISSNTNFTVAVPLAFDTISVSGNVLTVTGTAGAGVPADLQLFDASFNPLDYALVEGGQDGAWSAVFDMGARPTGTYNVRLYDYDVTFVNDTFNYTDTTLPATPILLSPSTAEPIVADSVLLSGTAEPNADVVIYVDDLQAGSGRADSSGAWTFTISGSGVVRVSLEAFDAAGNRSGLSQSYVFNFVDAPPTISSISPAVGSASAPTPVTIIGGNFSASGNSVTFGGVAGTITFESPTSITVTPPTSVTQGLVDVVVTNSGNQSVTQDDGYRYLLPPTLVVEFSPPTLGAGATGSFRLTFTNPNDVAVSGLALSDTQFPTGLTTNGSTNGCSNGSIIVGPNGFRIAGGSIAANASCTVSRGATSTTPGSYSVTTGVPSISGPVSVVGTATSTTTPLTVISAPTIATITPDAGPRVGGTSITITGTNLDGATAVSIGGAQATGIVVASDGLSLTATTGASSFLGSRNVFVTTPGGSASGVSFNYVYEPIITAVTPFGGPTAGGDVVTITGLNFLDATAVTFQGVAAPSFTINSNTSITATTPAGTAGLAPVAVTATGGTGTSANGYTYVAAPAAPVVSVPADASVTEDNTPTYSGTAAANATVEVFVDGSSIGTTTSAGGGAWTLTQPTVLADGVHAVSATVTTVGGTSAPSATINFTVDATAPASPVLTSPADGERVNSVTPTLIGTVESGASVLVYIDDAFLISVPGFATIGGDWGTGLPVLGEGAHTIYTIARDAAGNMSPPSATTAFVIDTITPAAPVLTLPANGSITSVATPTITGTAEAGASVAVTIDGSVVGTVVADGSGDWTFTPTALADGSHTVRATATDEAGNVSSTSTTVSFTVDTTAPTAPVVTYPVDGTTLTNRTPLITGTAEPGTTVTVTVGGGVRTVTADESGNWSSTPNVLTDGTHIVLATSTDSAGNTSPTSAPVTFVIDLTAPAAPVITAPTANQIFGLNTPTFSGTAEAGASVAIALNGSLAETITADGSGNWTLTSTPLADGMYAMTATASDAVGNVSSVSPTTNFTVDTAAPALPVVRKPVDFSVIPDSTPTFEGRTEGGAIVTITVDGSVVGTAAADGFGDWSLTSTELADGPHTFSAVATDRAGNASAATPTITFTVDATAPLAPTIIAPANGSLTSSRDISFSGTAEPGTLVEVARNGTVFANGTTDGAGGWTFGLTGLVDGTYVLTAHAQDAAGNRSAVSSTTVTLDATAPAAPVITAPVDGTVTRETRPTISGTADVDSTVTVIIDGTSSSPVAVDGSGNWSLTAPVLAHGQRVISATATDAAGNVSAGSTAITLFVDVEAPVAPQINAPAAESVTADPTPTIMGTTEAGSTVTVTIDGTTAGTTVADMSGNWTLTSAPLADGSHTVSATASDAVGNVSSVSQTTNFTVDTAAPALPVVRNPVNFSVIPDSTPTFEGRTEGGATVTITVDGSVVGTAAADGFGDWSLTSTELADGPHTFSAIATDRAGNASAATPTITFTVDATAPLAPTIIAPVNGSWTTSRDISFSGTAEPGTLVEVARNGTVFANGTTDGAGGWTFGLTGLADGPYVLTAYAQDAAGNRSPVSSTTVSVDATAPETPVITAPVDGTVTREARPTISGTADSGSTVLLTINGGPPITIPVTSKRDDWSYVPTADLAAGLNLLSAVSVDDVGNVSAASAAVRVTYSPVTITTTTLASGQVGVAYAETIEVTGGTAPYSLTVSAGLLPGGVTLSDGGELSGTPTASGDFAFTVTATDANGLSTRQALSLGVARPADPEVTDVTDVEVTANPNGSGEPTVIDLSGSVRNATRIEIVTPPAYGTATADGFAVTYSPNPGYFGTDSFTYRAVGFVDGGAANAAPAQGGSPSSAVSEPATVSIVITAPTLTLTGGVQPAGEVGVAYSQVLTATGGTAPYTYVVTAGALPTGVTLDGDGTLSGSPTAGGTFSFTVTATDSSTGTGPFSVSAVHDLSIAAPTLTVTPSTLSDAVAAQEYSATFATSGGTGPYSYAVTAGTLPSGMSLSTTGVLSGVPTQGGSFAFTVTATDASTGAGPYSASQAVTLTVTASAIAVTPATLAGGTRGIPYAASVSASGGVEPYTYAVSAGTLPTGLTLSPAGEISGTPTALGTFAFQISATDSATGAGPYSGTVDLSVTITALTLVVTPTVLPDVLAGVPYSQQLTASGGQGGYTFALTTGSLPPGLTLSAAGLIDGKPTTAGVFAFTVTATDGFGNTGAAALTVTVTGRPDPSADADVRGLNAAQGEATRRMVGTQIDNFGRRLEQLHTGAEVQDAYSLNLTLDGSAFSPLDEARQARGPLGEAMSAVDPGRHDSTDRAELDRMVWGDREAASGPGAGVDGRMNAGGQQGPASSASGLRVWAGGAISLGERDATTQTAEMSITTSGLSVGVDASVTDQLDLGVGVGMGQENVDVGLEDSRLESVSWVGVVYGSWRPQGDLFVDGMLGYGQLGFDMRRRTPVDDSLVFGQRDGTAWFGSLSAGLDRDIGAARWIGYGRIDVLDADLDAYAETGSPLWALSYDARNLQSRQGSLGLRYERVVLRGADRWTPGLRAEWTHEFGDAEAQTLRYADWLDGPSYSIAQDGWQRSRLTLGLSLGWRSDSGWSWLAEYEGRYSDGETLNGLRIKLAKLF